MFKAVGPDGKNNLAGPHIREFRLSRNNSLREFALFLQANGLDWDYNQLHRAETGLRIISDIEVKKLSEITNISIKKLLEE